MSNYLVGEVIRDTRIRRGYTQEQLSFGICTAASLSRIENGSQTPGKHILDALLERLGMEESVYNMYVSKEEMEIAGIIREMTRSIAGYHYTKLARLIPELEQLIGEKHPLQRQYLLFAKGVLKKGMQGGDESVMQLFMDAIHITLPQFDGETPLNANLLTFQEITIINNIAILHAKEGRMEQALRLGYWLKGYMEKSLIDGSEKISKYPMILYNLSNWLGKVGQFEEAEKIAELGIDFCILYGNLTAFPLLIFNKACALAEVEGIEKAQKFFEQSTVIFEATMQEERARKTVDFCKERYHLDIS